VNVPPRRRRRVVQPKVPTFASPLGKWDIMAAILDDVNPSLLVVVVDVDFEGWAQRGRSCLETQVTYAELVASLVIFCNAYVLMHRHNRLCVLASHTGASGGCLQIYPRRNIADIATADSSTNQVTTCDDFVPLGHLLSSLLGEGLLQPALSQGIASAAGKEENVSSAALSSALSKAVCIINRQLQLLPKLQPRLLVVQLGKDHAPSYNSIMNSIFSADKMCAPMDAVILSTSDSHFLQQACYLTRGVYQRPLDQRDLLQVLLTHCLPSSFSRQTLQLPVQRSVDFRAACACHKKPVEFAYMCSVCLALFCERADVCQVCGTGSSGD